MIFTVISLKRGSVARADVQLRNLESSKNSDAVLNPLSPQNLQLQLSLSPSTFRSTSHRFKPKKETSVKKPTTATKQCLLESISSSRYKAAQTLSTSISSTKNVDPCEHALNASPVFYRSTGRDLILQRDQQQHSIKFSRKEKFFHSMCHHSPKPIPTFTRNSEPTGFGCLPKAERVAVAPNSKADSYIYKNEYRSFNSCSDVNRMSNLKKSRDAVTMENSPCRLSQLMMPNHQDSIMRLIKER
jgi:hypothetical protein